MTALPDPSPAASDQTSTARDSSPWTGRIDGDGPGHARWHQRIADAGDPGRGHAVDAPHVALVGFRSDEGVRRNAGRVGAADGPEALRHALSPLALHGPCADGSVHLLDHGDAVTVGEALESGQAQAAERITAALDTPGNLFTIVLGGGHETAWATYQGLQASRRLSTARPRPRVGVLNLDAHFDLREAPRPTSGTPFGQMACAEQEQGRALQYAVLGIAEPSNTGVLFERARQIGARWMTDLEVLRGGAPAVIEFVEQFCADLDVLHLSIDLDVLPASVAPGVSAPAGLGVDPGLIALAVSTAATTGTLAVLDVVELNPHLDQDQRTARTAARLIDLALTQDLGSRATA